MNNLDFIINDFFVVLGGLDFVYFIVGFALSFVIIVSLIDFIID